MNIRQYLDATYLKTASQAGLSEEENDIVAKDAILEAIGEGFKLIMIRPEKVDLAKEMISKANSNLRIGTVIDFPEGKSDIETKIKEAIEMVIEISGKKGKLKWKQFDTKEYYGDKYEDIPRRIPDVSKAKRILGWEAKTSLRDGLKKTIDWSKKNRWWLELKN